MRESREGTFASTHYARMIHGPVKTRPSSKRAWSLSRINICFANFIAEQITDCDATWSTAALWSLNCRLLCKFLFLWASSKCLKLHRCKFQSNTQIPIKSCDFFYSNYLVVEALNVCVNFTKIKFDAEVN